MKFDTESDFAHIKVKISTLSDLLWNYEPNAISDSFGWGLGIILNEIAEQLDDLQNKIMKEEGKPA